MSISPRKTLDFLTPYTPGTSIDAAKKELGLKNVIKMASNENPLGPGFENPNELINDLKNSHLYPDISTSDLIPLLAKSFSVTPENIILGNGSDEICQMLALAYLNPGDQVIVSEHTFSEYEFVTKLLDGKTINIPMNNLQYDVDAIAKAVTKNTKLIFIANPNNPTGTYINQMNLETLINKVGPSVLVVIDEAYVEYAEAEDFPNSVGLLSAYDNVVILRTFSKIFGLAGFRIGYGLGSIKLIGDLNKVRQPFNVNSLSLKAATLAWENESHIERSLKLNSEGKKFLYQALNSLKLDYVPSEGNFILINLPIKASTAYDGLLSKGIIIRALTSFGLPNAIRVTIGKQDQNDAFIKALKSILEREYYGKNSTIR